MAYYNSAFVLGKSTHSQRIALITLLCKNFDLQQLLPQWRPISLLTIDYKIISKAMSLRLKKSYPILFIITKNVQWRVAPYMMEAISYVISLIMFKIDPIWVSLFLI